MKRLLFIYSLFTLISLLSSVNLSFAILDEPLVVGGHSLFKDLRPKNADFRSQDPRYHGRSDIYASDYPKMVMIHPYNHWIHNVPFSAELPQAKIPQPLKNLLASVKDPLDSGQQVIYSFVVQTLEPNLTSTLKPLTSPNDPFTVRPHYLTHPDASEIFRGKNYKTSVRWTVVPGVEGRVEPASGGLSLRWNDIQTHNIGGPAKRMGVSPNSMHLKGIEKINIPQQISCQHNFLTKHHDCYSLVAYTDDEIKKKIVAITYHWLLTERDWKDSTLKFIKTMGKANTLRELLEGRPHEFEGIGTHPAYTKLVGELKHYLGLTPRIEKNDEKKEVIINSNLPSPKIIPEPKIESKSRNVMSSFKTVSFNLDSAFGSGRAKDKAQEIKRKGKTIKVITDNNAEASYQLESERFPVTSGEKISIPYEITVEAGGKMSLGLLNTKTTGWYGKELFLNAGIHKGVYTVTVPEGESETSLVFRNAHFQRNGGPGQTTFTIKNINILKNEAIKLGPTFGSFKPRGEAQQIIDDGKTIKVITKEDTVSYVLMTNKFSVNPGENISIPYEITVEADGKMSLGLLNTKTTGWYGQQLFLSAGEHKGVYNVTVPEGETEASLVFRNAHLKTPGQTNFTIHKIKIDK